MIHDGARTGFGQGADVYAAARPTYHRELVDRFIGRYGAGKVVELGAGTGIFTSQLVDGGCHPIAIEPVAAMRDKIVAAYPNLTVIDGTAERTGLDDHSVHTVVAAQAFHWFDHARTLAEIERILRPGGVLVCVWNVRDERVEWVRRYTEIVERFAGDTPRHRSSQWRNAIDEHGRFASVDDWSIANPVAATPQQVADRALSTSFIAALDPERQRAVAKEIHQLAATVGDTIQFPYRSELQAWKLSDDSR
ncbi:MAG: class I SAM-dependent methyltransferase [Actinomycetota bacterium]